MSERDVEGLRLVGFSGTKASGREAGVALYRHRTRPSFLPGITAPRIRGSWQGQQIHFPPELQYLLRCSIASGCIARVYGSDRFESGYEKL